MKEKKVSPKNIWMVTREYGGLAGAGGVKDVTLQLSRALAGWPGRKISIVLPMYGFMDPADESFTPLADPLKPDAQLSFEVDMNYTDEERRERIEVWYGKNERVHIYLLASPRFQEKGDVYGYSADEARSFPDVEEGAGHFDYFAMNVLLQKGVLQLLISLQEHPDIIHCHDGHTALLPAMIYETPYLKRYFGNCGFLVTVHNAGIGYHQEVADLAFAQAITGLPWSVILKSRLQEKFDPFLAASFYASLNTVSENYARELRETEEDGKTGWLGHHLMMNGVRLEGITNGIDVAEFDPKNGFDDLNITFDPTDSETMEGKKQCKQSIIELLKNGFRNGNIEQYGKLVEAEGPLFTFIGRLNSQKGIDILRDAVNELVNLPFQLVVLGRGSYQEEIAVGELASKPELDGKVCFLRGYDPSFAKKIFGAGDFFLVPSRFEPCGLTDFIAQLYGNLPIVHHIGGLVKVRDGETGLAYYENNGNQLALAMKRGMDLFGQPEKMDIMRKEAVKEIHKKYTWKIVMQRYLDLYRSAMRNSG